MPETSPVDAYKEQIAGRQNPTYYSCLRFRRDGQGASNICLQIEHRRPGIPKVVLPPGHLPRCFSKRRLHQQHRTLNQSRRARALTRANRWEASPTSSFASCTWAGTNCGFCFSSLTSSPRNESVCRSGGTCIGGHRGPDLMPHSSWRWSARKPDVGTPRCSFSLPLEDESELEVEGIDRRLLAKCGVVILELQRHRLARIESQPH